MNQHLRLRRDRLCTAVPPLVRLSLEAAMNRSRCGRETPGSVSCTKMTQEFVDLCSRSPTYDDSRAMLGPIAGLRHSIEFSNEGIDVRRCLPSSEIQTREFDATKESRGRRHGQRIRESEGENRSRPQ